MGCPAIHCTSILNQQCHSLPNMISKGNLDYGCVRKLRSILILIALPGITFNRVNIVGVDFQYFIKCFKEIKGTIDTSTLNLEDKIFSVFFLVHIK